jgi:hypothetical protein
LKAGNAVLFYGFLKEIHGWLTGRCAGLFLLKKEGEGMKSAYAFLCNGARKKVDKTIIFGGLKV